MTSVKRKEGASDFKESNRPWKRSRDDDHTMEHKHETSEKTDFKIPCNDCAKCQALGYCIDVTKCHMIQVYQCTSCKNKLMFKQPEES
jgi:hypothetical protein